MLASAVLALFALALPSHAIDWKSFEDPNAFLLTDSFARSIGELPAPEKAAALKRLHQLLLSREVEVRRRAALTLGRLGDRSGVPVMVADLSRATGRDRDNVVVVLRILKDERAIPALRAALKDQSPYVRSIAVASLGELKAVAAYDEVVALTRDREGIGAGKAAGTLNCIRSCPADTACYALGALGDERAVPVLIGLLMDKDLRWPARQALEVLTKQKLANTENEQMRQLIQSPVVSVKVKQRLEQAVVLRQVLARTQRVLQEQQQQLQQITEDQARLRAKLRDMPSTAADYKRHLQTLSDQEAQIEALQEQIKKLQAQEVGHRKQLDELLARLSAE
jgi:HEAT repeat protein